MKNLIFSLELPLNFNEETHKMRFLCSRNTGGNLMDATCFEKPGKVCWESITCLRPTGNTEAQWGSYGGHRYCRCCNALSLAVGIILGNYSNAQWLWCKWERPLAQHSCNTCSMCCNSFPVAIPLPKQVVTHISPVHELGDQDQQQIWNFKIHWKVLVLEKDLMKVEGS